MRRVLLSGVAAAVVVFAGASSAHADAIKFRFEAFDASRDLRIVGDFFFDPDLLQSQANADPNIEDYWFWPGGMGVSFHGDLNKSFVNEEWFGLIMWNNAQIEHGTGDRFDITIAAESPCIERGDDCIRFGITLQTEELDYFSNTELPSILTLPSSTVINEVYILSPVGSQDYLFQGELTSLRRVPEPTTLLLLVIGLAGLVLRRRRRHL